MPEERNVAGLRCGEVLARLSDYVDGELATADTELVEAHLRGCDWCARFGGEFADAVKALRERLGADVPAGLHERTKRRFSG